MKGFKKVKEQASDLLEKKGIETVYATLDGNCFLERNHAESNARISNTKCQDVLIFGKKPKGYSPGGLFIHESELKDRLKKEADAEKKSEEAAKAKADREAQEADKKKKEKEEADAKAKKEAEKKAKADEKAKKKADAEAKKKDKK